MSVPTPRALPAIFWGGAICGVLDISSAFIIWYSRGVRLSRGLQGLASGLLGRDAAFSGGGKTAALGLAIHFTVAFSATIIFYLISRKLTFMTRQPVTSGFAYGLCVYLFMYHIIIPTFFGPRQPAARDTITAILIHLFLIGLPISLSVRRFARN